MPTLALTVLEKDEISQELVADKLLGIRMGAHELIIRSPGTGIEIDLVEHSSGRRSGFASVRWRSLMITSMICLPRMNYLGLNIHP